MAYRDLREFVAKLEKAGELKRIRAEVDPVLEITEVAQRVARDAKRSADSVGPALLFENPKGSRVPLLINTFGSLRRMELAFEVERLDDVAARIQGFLKMETPQGLFDKIKMLPKLAELGSFFPKSVKSGPCKEVIYKGADVNLLRLSDFEVLAAGWRTLYYVSVGVHEKSGDRKAQRGDVSHAGLRSSERQGCIGRRRSMARNIFGGRGLRIRRGRLRCRWRLARIRQLRWQGCCRFRRTWMK